MAAREKQLSKLTVPDTVLDIEDLCLQQLFLNCSGSDYDRRKMYQAVCTDIPKLCDLLRQIMVKLLAKLEFEEL